MNKYQKQLFDMISEKPIAYNPKLAKLIGSLTAGVLLSQLLYWWGNKKDEEWIYKTIADLEEETALSRKEQDGAIKKLKDLGLIEVTLKGIPAVRHFRLNFEAIYKLVCTKGTNSVVQKSQTNTENTQRTTTNVVEETSSSDIDGNHLNETPKEKQKPAIKEKVFGDPVLNEGMELLKQVFPTVTKLQLNRYALSRLIKKKGKARVFKALHYAKAVQEEKYSPSIFNFIELEQKWDRLELYARKEQNERNNGYKPQYFKDGGWHPDSNGIFNQTEIQQMKAKIDSGEITYFVGKGTG